MEDCIYKEMNLYEYDVGHMTKMAAKPICMRVKKTSKLFFSGTGRLISTILGM